MFNIDKQTIKRYSISTALTFGASFAVTLGALVQAQVEVSDPTTWSTAVIAGILISAGRAAFKVAFEWLVSKFFPISNPQ